MAGNALSIVRFQQGDGNISLEDAFSRFAVLTTVLMKIGVFGILLVNRVDWQRLPTFPGHLLRPTSRSSISKGRQHPPPKRQ